MARMTIDADLAELMTTVFRDYARASPGDDAGAAGRAGAAGARAGAGAEAATWDGELWGRLSALGLARLTGSESSGGSGAGWIEAAELLRAAASHAVRVPVAEHDLLACWLLERAGLPVGDARRTACLVGVDGRAASVPWASQAERVVVVAARGDGYVAADVDAEDLDISPDANLAGEPRDDVAVRLADVTGSGVPVSALAVEQLRLRSALVRAVQVSAVLDKIVELSAGYAAERVQFGRPLARFQAVQNLVADATAEAALARAATEAALREAVRSDWSAATLRFHVAVARSCAGHAASVVVRNAHQVHGAIGTTREHALPRYTRLALAWRSEYGTVHYWDEQVTAAAVAAGGPGLWPLITR
jgi:acyl-CoA dehydrogenase